MSFNLSSPLCSFQTDDRKMLHHIYSDIDYKRHGLEDLNTCNYAKYYLFRAPGREKWSGDGLI